MKMLALTDAMVVGQWVFNALITIAMAYVLATRQEKSSLRDKLEAAAGDLVEKRMAVATASLDKSIAVILEQVRQQDARLEKGDGSFDRVVDKIQGLELKLAARVDGMKDFVRETCASREDMRAMADRFDALQRSVARAEAIYCDRENLRVQT